MSEEAEAQQTTTGSIMRTQPGTAWETSVILPLFKKGNAEEHTNYRPISLIPAMSKIFEKIIARELQILIDLMAEYLESKKLRLNLGKTEIIIFNKGGIRNLVENEKFRFKEQKIKVAEEAKYLGFTLKPNCSWKEHLNKMSKRGKAAVGAILRNDLVKKSKSLKMFKQIFDSKIKPAIHYVAELWNLEAADKL
ncbi:hypothetical protein QYM36_014932 [Artemia franciscana]|uniref:Reverse transcriptase domain-containing protein n=1 Tax=Artemia franciscana TaxID=6661 RepID=A0AA88L436_ARTSF|nr:hypothetical protein QYM36_014932 [Artemia franciscana]